MHNLERILILEEKRIQVFPVNKAFSIRVPSQFSLSKKRTVYVDAIRREMQKIYQKGFEFQKSMSTFIKHEIEEK